MANNDKEMRRAAVQKLLALAKDKGFSPEQIAKETGIGFTCVYMYKNGTRIPSTDAICRIADMLGVNIEMTIRHE